MRPRYIEKKHPIGMIFLNISCSNRNKYKTTKAIPIKHGVHQVQSF